MQTPNHSKVKMGSERSFGFVFAAVFAVIGLWPLWSGGVVRLWALAAAAAIALLGVAWPATLKPFNVLWFKCGLLLAKITTPIVMAVLYYGFITPFGVAMRLFGKRPLAIEREPRRESYWIQRVDAGPAPGSMRNQF